MTSIKGPGEAQALDGSSLRVAIVHARWNAPIVAQLVSAARAELQALGVQAQNVLVESVPGSWELPAMVGAVVERGRGREDRPDAVIAVGVLIRGETMHFEYIARAVSQGLMTLQLERRVPVVFGVLTVLDEEQAWARAGGRPGQEEERPKEGTHNHGTDWARAAVEMGLKVVRSEE